MGFYNSSDVIILCKTQWTLEDLSEGFFSIDSKGFYYVHDLVVCVCEKSDTYPSAFLDLFLASELSLYSMKAFRTFPNLFLIIFSIIFFQLPLTFVIARKIYSFYSLNILFFLQIGMIFVIISELLHSNL